MIFNASCNELIEQTIVISLGFMIDGSRGFLRKGP